MFAAELRVVQRAVDRVQADVARLTDENTYALDYLLSQPVGEGGGGFEDGDGNGNGNGGVWD